MRDKECEARMISNLALARHRSKFRQDSRDASGIIAFQLFIAEGY